MAESAGILMFRNGPAGPEVLLVHPGGPFWSRRDFGAWSIPKGELDPDEDLEAAARREFAEEVGMLPSSELHALGRVAQNKQKHVTAFALRGDFDISTLRSNMIDVEWPPKSGRLLSIPEVDRAAWFSLPNARIRLLPGQVPLIDQLESLLAEHT